MTMAHITLALSPELDAKLRTAAAQQGVEPEQYVIDTLQQSLQPQESTFQPTAKTEAELLQVINSGLSAAAWDEYHALIEKRQAEALTPDEHARLIEFSDHLEMLSVRRLQALLQLAELRGDSLQHVIEGLGIQAQISG
jgi:hypothetical protein